MTRVLWILLIALAGAATVLRSPELVIDAPRLWAEEGRVYLSDALNHDAIEAFTNPHMGYYSLSANLAATAAAHAVELEDAPYVTTWLALLFQLAPIVVIATSTARPWATPTRKLIAIAIVLATTQGEVWLNTVNSQFFLAIGAALVLVETLDQGKSVCNCWGRRALLVVAGLAGAVPAFLSPLWLWAALRTKSREAWVRVAIVALCSALQLWVATSSIGAGAERTDDRLHGVSVGTAGAVVVARLVVEPLAGTDAVVPVADALRNLGDSDGLPYHLVGGAVLAIVLGGLVVSGRRTASGLLALASVIVVTGSLVASWGAPEDLIRAGHNTRYVVFPVTCLLLFIADRSMTSQTGWRWLGAALVAAAIVRGGLAWESGVPRDDAWPSWRTEVARYREDPTHRPNVWPGDPWHVIVDKTKTRLPGVRVLGEPTSPKGAFTGRLHSTEARLGAPLVVEINDAPPNATGFVALDAGILQSPAKIPGLDGCTTWLPSGIDGLRKVPFTCDASGHWTYKIDLEIVAAISGQTYTIQARFQTPEPAVSNAVALTIGF